MYRLIVFLCFYRYLCISETRVIKCRRDDFDCAILELNKRNYAEESAQRPSSALSRKWNIFWVRLAEVARLADLRRIVFMFLSFEPLKGYGFREFLVPTPSTSFLE